MFSLKQNRYCLTDYNQYYLSAEESVSFINE